MARSQVGRRSEDQEKVSSVEWLHRSVVVGLGLDVDLETVFDDVQQVPELVQLSLGNSNRVLQINICVDCDTIFRFFKARAPC